MPLTGCSTHRPGLAPGTGLDATWLYSGRATPHTPLETSPSAERTTITRGPDSRRECPDSPGRNIGYMCGIFGYVGTRDEAPQLVLAGLKKLDYRGYDSWGIAARQNGTVPARLVLEKHVGKIGGATTSLPEGHAALGH